MDLSRIRSPRFLFPTRKPVWPNPEASVGKFYGTVKGKYKYWEAIGPAKEAYEKISEALQEVLNSSCGPVRCSSIVNYDIYMVGRTSATAVPNIMFSCKRVESRKQAMVTIRKSGILEERAPGIDVGHWVCPPHIVNLQLFASNCHSTTIGWVTTYNLMDVAAKVLLDDPGTLYSPPGYCGSNMEDLSYYPRRDLNSRIQDVWYSTRPIFDPSNPSRTLAMQLIQKRRLDDGSIVQRTATIGAAVEYCGKKFYLAPEHIFSTPQDDGCSATPNVQGTSDDSDCEFGAFSDDGEVTDEEVEFMSQYSLSPAPSDVESDADSSDAEHSEEEADEEYFPMPRYGSIPPGRILHAEGTQGSTSLLEIGSVQKDIQGPITTSCELDYVLIPADEVDASTSHLPIISEGNWARIQAEPVAVTAVTGSGCLLQGILSGRPSHLRLPNSLSFQKVFAVNFDGHLLPGDSGSIVRDAETGFIYGHIIAGSSEARMAYIIPTDAIITDLETLERLYEQAYSNNYECKTPSTHPVHSDATNNTRPFFTSRRSNLCNSAELNDIPMARAWASNQGPAEGTSVAPKRQQGDNSDENLTIGTSDKAKSPKATFYGPAFRMQVPFVCEKCHAGRVYCDLWDSAKDGRLIAHDVDRARILRLCTTAAIEQRKLSMPPRSKSLQPVNDSGSPPSSGKLASKETTSEDPIASFRNPRTALTIRIDVPLRRESLAIPQAHSDGYKAAQKHVNASVHLWCNCGTTVLSLRVTLDTRGGGRLKRSRHTSGDDHGFTEQLVDNHPDILSRAENALVLAIYREGTLSLISQETDGWSLGELIIDITRWDFLPSHPPFLIFGLLYPGEVILPTPPIIPETRQEWEAGVRTRLIGIGAIPSEEEEEPASEAET